MDLVKSNAALFATPIELQDTLDEFYRVFKAWVDMIKAHCGNSPTTALFIVSITMLSQ